MVAGLVKKKNDPNDTSLAPQGGTAAAASLKHVIIASGVSTVLVGNVHFPEALGLLLGDAKQFKDNGNGFFKDMDYAQALQAYREVVESTTWLKGLLEPDFELTDAVRKYARDAVDCTVHALTNSALCHHRMDQHQDVVNVANEALQWSPGCGKALFRRGRAYLSLGKAEKALRDLELYDKQNPNNLEAKDELKRAHQLIKQKAKKKKQKERANDSDSDGPPALEEARGSDTEEEIPNLVYADSSDGGGGAGSSTDSDNPGAKEKKKKKKIKTKETKQVAPPKSSKLTVSLKKLFDLSPAERAAQKADDLAKKKRVEEEKKRVDREKLYAKVKKCVDGILNAQEVAKTLSPEDQVIFWDQVIFETCLLADKRAVSSAAQEGDDGLPPMIEAESPSDSDGHGGSDSDSSTDCDKPKKNKEKKNPAAVPQPQVPPTAAVVKPAAAAAKPKAQACPNTFDFIRDFLYRNISVVHHAVTKEDTVVMALLYKGYSNDSVEKVRPTIRNVLERAKLDVLQHAKDRAAPAAAKAEKPAAVMAAPPPAASVNSAPATAAAAAEAPKTGGAEPKAAKTKENRELAAQKAAERAKVDAEREKAAAAERARKAAEELLADEEAEKRRAQQEKDRERQKEEQALRNKEKKEEKKRKKQEERLAQLAAHDEEMKQKERIEQERLAHSRARQAEEERKALAQAEEESKERLRKEKENKKKEAQRAREEEAKKEKEAIKAAEEASAAEARKAERKAAKDAKKAAKKAERQASECPYGRGCEVPNCAYMHSWGRDLDEAGAASHECDEGFYCNSLACRKQHSIGRAIDEGASGDPLMDGMSESEKAMQMMYGDAFFGSDGPAKAKTTKKKTPFDDPTPIDSPTTYRDDSDDLDECVLCMDGAKEYCMVPCGHKILCKGCASHHYSSLKDAENESKECMFCRAVLHKPFVMLASAREARGLPVYLV